MRSGRHVDSFFLSAEPKKKWDEFKENVARRSFTQKVMADPRTDQKLLLHADNMNRLATGRRLGMIPGVNGETYEIKRLRGSDELGCTCADWRYKKSVAPPGERECKHIRMFQGSTVKQANLLDAAHSALSAFDTGLYHHFGAGGLMAAGALKDRASKLLMHAKPLKGVASHVYAPAAHLGMQAGLKGDQTFMHPVARGVRSVLLPGNHAAYETGHAAGSAFRQAGTTSVTPEHIHGIADHARSFAEKAPKMLSGAMSNVENQRSGLSTVAEAALPLAREFGQGSSLAAKMHAGDTTTQQLHGHVRAARKVLGSVTEKVNDLEPILARAADSRSLPNTVARTVTSPIQTMRNPGKAFRDLTGASHMPAQPFRPMISPELQQHLTQVPNLPQLGQRRS